MSKTSEKVPGNDGFSGKFGFIIACIGSAVGMANIWRFPYLVSEYGGLTFLLPYLLFVVLIGCSGVMEEFALGRWGGAGPVGSFGKATEERWGKRRIGEVIGALPVIGAMGLAIGYSVIMGWIFKYTKLSITGELFSMGQDMDSIVGLFNETAPTTDTLGQAVGTMLDSGVFGIGNAWWIIIAVAVSVLIMAFGVSGGIEKACKVMIPILFVLFIFMAVYIATLPGAIDGYKYIFTLDPRGLANWEVWIYAFGQAFFSLSVAGNGSVIYGSYLNRDVSIPSSAFHVALWDTVSAIVATFVIIPAMATAGETLTQSGPGLMFIYLPNLFREMPGGRILMAVFFVAALFAGVTSLVNLFEAPTATLQEKLHLSRGTAVAVIGVVGLAVGLCIQGIVSGWMDVCSIYACPIGALLAGVFFYWVLKKEDCLVQVNLARRRPLGRWFYPTAKYLYCGVTVLVLILGAVNGGIG